MLAIKFPVPPLAANEVLPYLQAQYKELNRLVGFLNNALNQSTAGKNGLLPFATAGSGFVLRGREHLGYYRLLIDDATYDPADEANTYPISGVEQVTSFQPGDIIISNPQAGPVISSSVNKGLFRFFVTDSDLTAPAFGIEPVVPSNIVADDYVFSGGASWINKGRTKGYDFLWLIGVEDEVGFARFVL